MNLTRVTGVIRAAVSFAAVMASGLLTTTAWAQPLAPVPDPGVTADAAELADEPLKPLPKSLEKLLQGSTSLNPNRTVFLNLDDRRLFLRTHVSCRDCVLEMLCVPEHQREHETILAIRARAYVIHSGLLALGLQPGTPVKFYPEFEPPRGPEIRMVVHWQDANGQVHEEDARSWIRHTIHRYFNRPLPALPEGVTVPLDELRYDPFNKELIWFGPMSVEQKARLLGLSDDPEYQEGIRSFFDAGQSRPMMGTFVFTGSRWDEIDTTGQRRYAAEDGHLITVANFSSATIDIAEESTASDGGQTYEGWTERIPAEGTSVILELIPGASDAAAAESHPGNDSGSP